jgi:hypothetical protein
MTHQLALCIALVANLAAGMLLAHVAAAPLRRRALRQRVERAQRPRPLTVPVELPPPAQRAPSEPIGSHVRARRLA